MQNFKDKEQKNNCALLIYTVRNKERNQLKLIKGEHLKAQD